MASDRLNPLVTRSPAAERLFTVWFTSTDGLDHAVTDEEFHDHRPEPEAVCGAVILLAPMEWAPGPRCPRCVAFLRARESLRDLDDRVNPHRHRRAGWLARILHGTLSPVVPRPRTGARYDHPEPSAGMRANSVSAGPERSAGAWSDAAPAGPQPPAEDQARSSAGTASATAYRPVAVAEATQPPVETRPGPSTGPQPPGAGEAQLGRHWGTALPCSPPCGRQGPQTPAGAACSPAAAPVGHHGAQP